MCRGGGEASFSIKMGELHFLTGVDVTPEHVLKLLQFLRLCSTAVQTGGGKEASGGEDRAEEKEREREEREWRKRRGKGGRGKER